MKPSLQTAWQGQRVEAMIREFYPEDNSTVYETIELYEENFDLLLSLYRKTSLAFLTMHNKSIYLDEFAFKICHKAVLEKQTNNLKEFAENYFCKEIEETKRIRAAISGRK